MKILEDKGYVYKKHLSTGGEGEVHLIKSVDKELVAKIFSTLNKDSINILEAIKELDINGIPEIHEIFNHENKTIIIRDFVEGTTLYDEIKKNGYLSFNRAKTIILKICQVLKELHNAKPNPIIYRDVKPENIIVTPKGDIYLIDFGIARYYKKHSIRDTMLAGTMGYTAPEVMAGMQSDTRSDVYSAGLLFYEMLTGKSLLEPPFQIRPVRESNEYLPDWLDAVIEKATDLNQTNRYRTIEGFINAIENPIIAKKKPKTIKRKWFLILAFIIISGIIAVLLLLIINSKGNTDDGKLQTTPIPEATELVQTTSEPTPTVLEENTEDFEVLLDLQFNDLYDFDWLYLIRDTQYHKDNEGSFSELAHDSVFDLKYEFGMNYKFSAGDIFHIRIKPGQADDFGTLLLLCFSPHIDNQWHEDSFEIKFDNKQPFAGEIRTDYGYYYEHADGSPMLVSNKWYDVIVYLDEDEDAFKYFVFESENSTKMVIGGAAVLDYWQGLEYEVFIDIYYHHWVDADKDMPVSQVDFIRHSKGSIIGYLKSNIEIFYENEENIIEFANKNFEFIPQEEYIQHGF